MDSKPCKWCHVVKPLSEFYRQPNAKDRLQGHCKLCASEYARKYNLAKKYGLSLEDAQRIYDEQDGLCAICDEELNGRYQVDHDHSCCPGQKTCGKCLRGLLCRSCNHGLGHFKDSVDALNRAAYYLSTGNLSIRDAVRHSRSLN